MAEIINAGPFVTKGEERTAAVLKQLPNSWIVICNKMLVIESGLDYELDFIIIADHTVFLLEAKSFREIKEGTDQIWILPDGSSQESPLNKVNRISKKLATRLRDTVPPLKKENARFVSSGVVLSEAKKLPQLAHDDRAKRDIYLLPNVCQQLMKRDVEEGMQGRRGPIIKRFRSQIRDSLYDLANRPETPTHINQIYTIEDAINVRPGVRKLNARLIDWDEPRILLLYDLTKSSSNRDNARQFYLREFKALHELHKTCYVPDVKDPFLWSDDFIVLPMVPPEGKALPAYPPPVMAADLINELHLAACAFIALATIHQQNVIHRAINPGAIYVQQVSPPFGLTFTDFYAARIEGVQTISKTLDELEIEGRYMAPELNIGYGYARPHTDVFSLALVFLERWSGEPLEALRPDMRKSAILPDLCKQWASLPVREVACLNELFHSIYYPSSGAPRLRPSEIAGRLGEIARSLAK